MIVQDGAPHLMLDGVARQWSLRGYGAPTTPRDGAMLITPPSTVAALRAATGPGSMSVRSPTSFRTALFRAWDGHLFRR
jgi:hypothetical protein